MNIPDESTHWAQKKTGKYVSADFRVLVLSVWDWLSSIQSTSFLIFIIKKGGDIITSLTGLVQSPPPPILLFSVSDAVAQSQTSVVSCQDASAKISRSGCWEAFWANEESRCRCCQMCKHSRYVCSSGCKAANGLTEERRLGRGVYDREAGEETASSKFEFRVFMWECGSDMDTKIKLFCHLSLGIQEPRKQYDECTKHGVGQRLLPSTQHLLLSTMFQLHMVQLWLF